MRIGSTLPVAVADQGTAPWLEHPVDLGKTLLEAAQYLARPDQQHNVEDAVGHQFLVVVAVHPLDAGTERSATLDKGWIGLERDNLRPQSEGQGCPTTEARTNVEDAGS